MRCHCLILILIGSPRLPLLQRKVNAMNYLSDNFRCTVNGQLTRIAILIEDGHIIFFHRTQKSGIFGNIIQAGTVLIGGAVGLAAVPVALVTLAADALIGKLNNPDLVATINKIKVKYKLSDDEVFISDHKDCLVKLSEDYPCKVMIDGDFMVGQTINKCRIEMDFFELSDSIKKIFSKGKFPVSLLE